jgi:hypothetical protein
LTVTVISPGPIPGSTVLPAGFPHPHASDEARAIAENGMMLRVQVGSGVHGTSIAGQDDRDEMGLCLEPPQFITGLARVPGGSGGVAPSVRFEQYERHPAWDRPGGLANRARTPTVRSWWPCTGTTRSTPCTPCGWGCRASSC